MPRTKVVPLVIGIRGHVLGIHPTTGAELWRTKLRSTTVLTLCVVAGKVFAGAAGELYCLDGATGAILWHNPLKGLGQGMISFGVSEPQAAATVLAAQAAMTAAVIASTA